jgi:uncharacterized membrane protein YdjX (TVP38/TMEM64 family)
MASTRKLSKRSMLLLGSGFGLCGALGALWLFREHGEVVRSWVDQGLGFVRGAGPVTFFALMALLPAAGCPITVFTLTAGPVFGPILGLPLVLALVWVALAFNLTLTYGLSRWLLRPWLERLCQWMGYRIPEVDPSNHRALVIVVRVTPGPPYVLQSYLLGLAGVRFGTYFWISWVVSSLYACAFVVFGDALAHGKGKMALMGIGLFVALTVAVRLLKRKASGGAVG